MTDSLSELLICKWRALQDLLDRAGVSHFETILATTAEELYRYQL
jgi:hypothetical protein